MKGLKGMEGAQGRLVSMRDSTYQKTKKTTIHLIHVCGSNPLKV